MWFRFVRASCGFPQSGAPSPVAGAPALWQRLGSVAFSQHCLAGLNSLQLPLPPSFFPSRGQESSLSLSLAVYFSFPRCGMLQHLNFKNKGIDFYLEFLFVFFLTRELKKKLISSTPIEIVLHRQRGMQNAHLQYGLVIVAGK